MRTMVTLAGLLLTWGAIGGDIASADLVVNGGFETGDFSDWNYTSVDGFSFVDIGFPHGGLYAAFFGDLQEDGGGSISQSLTTTVGSSYVLSFWFAGDGDTPSGFSAIVGGNVLYQVTNPSFDANYNLYTFDFTAASASTLLQFTEYDDPGYINLDDVSVVPSATVPEPTSMVTLVLGVVILSCYSGCRRSRGR